MTTNQTHHLPNGTTIEYPDFEWDSATQGLVLASFFYGYILTQIPGGYLATKYGGKRVFLWGITATAVITIFTPLLAKQSTGLLVSARVVAGLCEGVTYPSIHAIWSRWAPPLEQSRITAFAFSGMYLGTVIAMPLAGILAEHINWESIFYVFGFLALLWCGLWWWIVEDSPEKDRSITDAELEYLQNTVGVTAREATAKPPWRAMMTSKAVWAIITAHFTENWGFYTLLTSLPMFMRDVLKYDLDTSGILAAFPYILMAIVVQVSGYIADTFRADGKMTTTHIRKMFTCGAYVGQAVFMLLTALIMRRGTSTVFLSLALGLGGLSWAGFGVNHLDIAPLYAPILMGISNTVGTLPGIMSPTLTGILIKDKTEEEWREVFLVTAAVYAVGALLYGLLASGEKHPACGRLSACSATGTTPSSATWRRPSTSAARWTTRATAALTASTASSPTTSRADSRTSARSTPPTRRSSSAPTPPSGTSSGSPPSSTSRAAAPSTSCRSATPLESSPSWRSCATSSPPSTWTRPPRTPSWSTTWSSPLRGRRGRGGTRPTTTSC